MKIAAAAGNSGRLFKLIRNTGGCRNTVSETIYDPDGIPIVGENRHLDRCIGHFRARFNRPAPVNTDSNVLTALQWSVTLEPSTD